MELFELDASVHTLTLRYLKSNDFTAVKSIMNAIYPRLGWAWTQQCFDGLLSVFKKGQLCIVDNGTVVAVALSVIVNDAFFGDEHTYDELFGNGYVSAHDAAGDVLYGLDVFFQPDCQNSKQLRYLYEARKALCARLKLRAITMLGRIPNYQFYADTHTLKQYVDAVENNELFDPILSFQLTNGFEVRDVIGQSNLSEPNEPSGYATVVEWLNHDYVFSQHKSVDAGNNMARVGCIQWRMRTFNHIEHFIHHVEYFIEALSDSQCDIAVFPELFNLSLAERGEHSSIHEAMLSLAILTPDIVRSISQLAINYNINIVAGSLPVVQEGELLNVAFFCHRNGTVDQQSKLQLKPIEKNKWHMESGHKINVIEADVGSIVILIGSDVEFAELTRSLCEKKVSMLFVPFMAKTKQDYLRIRRCAQARAIENNCYVAITGSSGHPSTVNYVDVHYSQTAVFAPIDVSFPADGIIAETTPNTEMTLIGDINLDKLEMLPHRNTVSSI